MRIGIIGTGGIGALYGGLLAEAGNEVHLISTARHVQAVGVRGLQIERQAGEKSFNKQVKVSSISTDGAPLLNEDGSLQVELDILLVTLKLYQLRELLDKARTAGAPSLINKLAGPKTLVLPVQNGVTAASLLAGEVGDDQVVKALAQVISFLIGPGQVRQLGDSTRLIMGDTTLSGRQPEQIEQFAQALRGAGIDAVVSPQIDHELWWKFALITTFGGVCALADAPIGKVREQADTRRLLQRSLREAQAVARSQGVELSEQDLDDILTKLDQSDYEATTSMQRDIKAGLPSELEDLNGSLLRLAVEAGIEVPVQETATAVLRLRVAASPTQA